ncbi:response regulator transcription factor [Herpetosiphon gulosus]|uniref:Alkaline phosphatase synthesis transcriptional regulatory protein PhoP n=1 Tax=Herpetosiphon gulosus TaxID=1973496 RepID=A0ABP9WXN4_9CHLR
MSAKILIVEDERKIAIGLQNYLEGVGYSTITASDGQAGLDMARREQPDLILLDLMLPMVDGFTVCRTLRSESSVPIIMLTARVEEVDSLAGLELGADDYITKPFSPRQVVARIKAVLRRVNGELEPPMIVRKSGIEIDLQRRTVVIEQNPITSLTPTEFDLLVTLVRSAGRPLTRSQLLDAVQGEEGEAYDRTVDAHIKNVRRKIEPNPSVPRYILTVFGVGYKFAE